MRKTHDRNIQVVVDPTIDIPVAKAQIPDAVTSDVSSQPEFAGNALLEGLRRTLEPEPAPLKPPQSVRKRAWALPDRHVLKGRLLKSTAAVVILAALFVNPSLRLMTSTSAEAVINARLITMRAPIDGEVASQADSIEVGTVYPSGATVLHLVNYHADSGRVDDLRRSQAALETESGSFAERLTYLKARRQELSASLAALQKLRLARLSADAADIQSQIAAGEARQKEIDQSLDRSATLKASGNESAAALGRAARDAQVNFNETEALRHRLEAAQVEMDATRRGLSVSDGYNDRPRSAELVEEIDRQINELETGLTEHNNRIVNLENDIKNETARLNAQSKAVLTAPVSGGLWEILTAPGELVHRGQDLVKLLDCGGSVVTAAVSEATYNDLRIGDPASFRLRGEQVQHVGKIIGLTGLAAAPSNFAILPASLEREPYRATIAIPDLAATSGCLVGRTGMVTFKKEQVDIFRGIFNMVEGFFS